MLRKPRTILAAGFLIFLLLTGIVGSIVIWRTFFKSYYLDVPIAEDIVIDSKWTEIHPPQPLRVGKEHQFVSIGVIRTEFTRDKGVTSSNAKTASPEIKLISTDGSEYTLVYRSARLTSENFEGIEYAEYGTVDGLPKSLTIEKVLLRSEAPISAKRILWSGYDWKDRP